MKRGLTVRRLAASAALDVEDVQLLLLEGGLDICDSDTWLSPALLKRAKSILKEARRPARARPAQRHLPELIEWPELDPEPVRFLSREEVLGAHEALVDAFAGTEDAVDPPGVRDDNFLEAALFRPQTEGAGVRKYPTVQLAGAALLHSLVLNHPFFNGNKRTALVSFVWYLRLNGHMILFTEDELYDLVLHLADHTIVVTPDGERPSADAEVLAIYDWLTARSRLPIHGDKLIIWHRLERILRRFDCSFGTPRSNRRNIHRDTYRTQVVYTRQGMDVSPMTVKKIRQDLCLDEEHGIDSAVFYEAAVPAKSPQEIIQTYRRVLVKLSAYDRGEVLETAG